MNFKKKGVFMTATMPTQSYMITFNAQNLVAKKLLDIFRLTNDVKVEKCPLNAISPAARKTMRAIQEAKEGINLTHCETFEDYLKAVAQ